MARDRQQEVVQTFANHQDEQTSDDVPTFSESQDWMRRTWEPGLGGVFAKAGESERNHSG
jgi:hypothetical protein